MDKPNNNKQEYSEHGFPIIYCDVVKLKPGQKIKRWSFYCDHCGTTHRHGAGVGLRASHCLKSGSPIGGCYVLRLAPGSDATSA